MSAVTRPLQCAAGWTLGFGGCTRCNEVDLSHAFGLGPVLGMLFVLGALGGCAFGVKRKLDKHKDKEFGELEAARKKYVILHVRGVGGKFEDKDELSKVFSSIGNLVQTTVRHREDEATGANTSWALVTMATLMCAEKVLASSVQLEEQGLTVALFSQKQADASTGAMTKVLDEVRDEHLDDIDEDTTKDDLEKRARKEAAMADVKGLYKMAASQVKTYL